MRLFLFIFSVSNVNHRAIRSVSFLISKTEVASSSDDCTIKIWDIPGEKVKRTLCDHAVCELCYLFGGFYSVIGFCSKC